MSGKAGYVVCPECQGRLGFEVSNWCGEYGCEHEECARPAWQPCRFCEGDGEVASIRAAVYLARGGPAPVQSRRFA